MDPVVHFEMPYEDRKRAAEFYMNLRNDRMTRKGWRVDLVAVSIPAAKPNNEQLTISYKNCVINYYQNVVA